MFNFTVEICEKSSVVMGDKQNNLDDQNRNQNGVAGLSNAESPPKIFKLSIDCLNEIFEYLNLKDLSSFGRTCTRMNKVAGEYFKQNFVAVSNVYERNGFCTHFVDENVNVSTFTRFITCIKFPQDDDDDHDEINRYRYIQRHINDFESIRHIDFGNTYINTEKMELMKKILPQLETVEILRDLNEPQFDGDLFELLLKHCVNLKNFHFRCKYGFHIDKDDWLLHQYPKLEHFEFMCLNSKGQVDKLRECLILNSNILKFRTNSDFLLSHRDIFLKCKLQLDVLEIYLRGNKCFELLNQLYEIGFYKRLYIFCADDDKNCISLVPLSPLGFETLYIPYDDDSYNLTKLTHLKELSLTAKPDFEEMQILANSLVNLERLYLAYCDNVDNILPFIRHSQKMKKIKFISHNCDVVLDLIMLNEERAKLTGAQKIIIYVSDYAFLATKWATKNGDTDLKFIEMRQSNSYKWDSFLFFQTSDV